VFRLTKNGAVNVIRVEGPITTENANGLCEFVDGTFSIGQPMTVIDLNGVPLIDSAGVEALCEVNEQHTCRGGQLKLAHPQALITDILNVTGVADQFDSHQDVPTAVGAFLR
jgi:anti-anti-sigma factor